MDFLWTIPLLPLSSAVILLLLRLPKPVVSALGAGSVGLSALLTLAIDIVFLGSATPGGVHIMLGNWITIDGFSPAFSLYLDGLSLVMMNVITGVGFLIHLYSIEYMAPDEGYRRYFAYMNLFVAAMLLLVLADNLLLLYLGWEGVGLCSYLLIGFWYSDPANGRAACKAFIVTRIGDTAMAIGLFLLFAALGTLNIQEILDRIPDVWSQGAPMANAAALLLLGGAVGKSAQLPLQTWLPDAMAGPTPVSALIHAATMVTAGVYLIARLHGLYELAPIAQALVAMIGAATLLISAISALAQTEMKKVLAYSTISQIGYMFLALGVSAWSAGIFHLMTHAFFKTLLFMAAGAVMLRMHHEQDIFRLRGLRRQLPAAYWTMLIGGAALAGVPLVTAGFFSKDAILIAAWEHGSASLIDGVWLWLAGMVGVLLTALYTFRMIFLVFFGEPQGESESGTEHGWSVLIPLAVLAALSIFGGLIDLPLAGALPSTHYEHGTTSMVLETVSGLVSLAGIAIAWWLYGHGESRVPELATIPARFARAGCGFDWLYDRLLVQPFVGIGRLNRNDVIDTFFDGVAWVNRVLHRVVTVFQTGRLRWYAASIAGGAVILLLAVGAP